MGVSLSIVVLQVATKFSKERITPSYTLMIQAMCSCKTLVTKYTTAWHEAKFHIDIFNAVKA
jgi:hypothetical protein